jgi:TetR/AcrR family transcriptional regulator, mexJK operon transcriptional repressor
MNSPAPQPRDDRKEEQILAAAKEAFLEHGFAGTSMDLVAQRAQASKTTLYARFPSKEALFKATISAECARHGMNFNAEAFDALSLKDALCRIGRGFVDLCWSPEAVRVHQIVTGEAPRFPEIARLFQEAGPEEACRAMTRYFERAAARGEIVGEDPRFLAEQFFTMLKGHTHFELTLGVGTPPPLHERDALVQRAVRLFLNGAAAPR